MSVLINNETGLAEKLDPTTIPQAVQSGKYSYALVDQEGKNFAVPAEEYEQSIQEGLRPADQKELQNLLEYAQYSSPTEQLKTAGESALRGATMGLGNVILGAALDNEEEQLARREANPAIAGVGEAAGLVGSALTGVGAAPMLERAGAAAAAKLIPQAVTPLARVGSAAAKAAVENAIYASGDEAAKAFMNDPDQTLNSAALSVGLSGVLGGVFGGGLSGAGELWKSTVGKSLASKLDTIADAVNNGKPLLVEMGGVVVPRELRAALSENPMARNFFEKLAKGESRAASKVQSAIEDTKKFASDSIVETFGKTTDELPKLYNTSKAAVGEDISENLVKRLSEKYEPIAQSYEKIESKFKTAALSDVDKSEIVAKLNKVILESGLDKGPNKAALKLTQSAIDDIVKQGTVQDLRQYASQLRDMAPFGSENYQIAKQLRSVFNEAQESVLKTKLAAEAPELLAEFNATQGAYKQFKGILEEVADRARLGKSGKSGFAGFKEILKSKDPEKIADAFSLKNKSGMFEVLSKEFPEVAEIVRQKEIDSFLKASMDSSGDAIDTKKLFKNFRAMDVDQRNVLMSPEQQMKMQQLEELIDKLTVKGGKKVDLEASPLSIGGIGAVFEIMKDAGSGIGGAITGMLAAVGLKEIPDAMRLAVAKFLTNGAPANSAAFRDVAKLASSAIKGNTAFQKAMGGLFDAGRVVAARPSKESIDKLEKLVDEYANDESGEKYMKVAGELGYYDQEAATLATASALSNVAYLNKLKPQTQPMGPLNKPRVPSKAEITRYRNALEIAENPLIVVERVKEGTLTMDDIVDLQNLRPGLYQRMQNQMFEKMADAVAKGKLIPYKTKMSMSLFMQSPVDVSLSPQYIQSTQSTMMPQQQQAPAGPVKPTATGMQKLDKLAPSYQTRQQTREMQRQKGQ